MVTLVNGGTILRRRAQITARTCRLYRLMSPSWPIPNSSIYLRAAPKPAALRPVVVWLVDTTSRGYYTNFRLATMARFHAWWRYLIDTH